MKPLLDDILFFTFHCVVSWKVDIGVQSGVKPDFAE
jgi:hypothetical protein